MNLDQIPIPSNIDSERCVLNAMLRSPECLSESIATLCEDDFHDYSNQSIFMAIKEVSKLNDSLDFKLLSSYMMDKAILDSVGGMGRLAEIFSKASSPRAFDGHRKIIKEKAVLRKALNAAKKIIVNVMEGCEESSLIVSSAESDIRSISDVAHSVYIRHVSDVSKDLADRVNRSIERGGRLAGIPTGFQNLDTATGGFKPGELILIAARPGIGKTVLGLNFASNMIFNKWSQEAGEIVSPGYNVGFFSLEMPDTDLLSRVISNKYNIEQKSIQRGSFRFEGEYNKFLEASTDICKTNLYFADTTSLTTSKLSSEIRRLKRNHDIDIVFIDYIQLIDSDDQKMPRHLQVAQVSRTIKRLSLELRIPVVAMAQLGRDGVEEPQLHNLRESGNLEADADIVFILHRTGESMNSVYPTQLRIAKNRSGPVCPIPFELSGSTQTFREINVVPESRITSAR